MKLLVRVCLLSFQMLAATLGALVISGSSARAGGFEENIQSVYGQGTSNAGVAAGGALSTMFWNPATMTQSGRFATDFDAFGILPSVAQAGDTKITPPGTAFGFTSAESNTVQTVLVPAGYVSQQLTDRLWVGLSLNAPFGLADAFSSTGWAGAFYGQNATFKTYNAAPTVAVKLADWISVGVGLQAEYAKATLNFASGISGPGVPMLAQLSGSGWGWGWTTGVMLSLTPSTQLGLGYRSAIDQKIDGSLAISGGLSTPGSITTTVKLPGLLTVGLRQALTGQLTLLGTVEWSEWSRIGTSNIMRPNGAALGPTGAPITIPFDYRDGWLYAIGLEYSLNPTTTLRGGVAYEISPITDQVRVPLIPDNDRAWFSFGATSHLTKDLSLDVAYSYFCFKNTPIDVTPGNPSFNGFVTYVGTVSSHFSVISIGVRYQFDQAGSPILVKG
jgi:long-chain fatty acid transport protein